MNKKNDNSTAPVRQYPVLYEKLVPIAISLIVLLILALLVITFGVALGVWANPV